MAAWAVQWAVSPGNADHVLWAGLNGQKCLGKVFGLVGAPSRRAEETVWVCEAARRWVCSEVCRSAGLDWAGYFFLSGKSDN